MHKNHNVKLFTMHKTLICKKTLDFQKKIVYIEGVKDRKR